MVMGDRLNGKITVITGGWPIQPLIKKELPI